MGNERTPWRIPLRSYVICAALAVELALIRFLVVPTGMFEKILLITFICASPAIQTLRVPIIKNALKGGEWKGREDDAAWADWFLALLTGAVLAVFVADFAIRKLELEPGFFSSTDVNIPCMNEWIRHSLLLNLGGYGTTLRSIIALSLAAVTLDTIVIWQFARFKLSESWRSLIAAVTADFAVAGVVAFVVFLPIAVDWLSWQFG